MNIRFDGNPNELEHHLKDLECSICGGAGIVYGSVYVRGENIPEGGMYEFEPRTCECQMFTPDRDEE